MPPKLSLTSENPLTVPLRLGNVTLKLASHGVMYSMIAVMLPAVRDW